MSTDEQSEELVVVLSTGDKARLALAKSLLDSAEVKYSVQSDTVQDFFVEGRLGTGFNPLTGPAEVRVAIEDSDAAKSILADLPEPRIRVLSLPIRIAAGLIVAGTLAAFLYQLLLWLGWL
jgi:hypothetical protein